MLLPWPSIAMSLSFVWRLSLKKKKKKKAHITNTISISAFREPNLRFCPIIWTEASLSKLETLKGTWASQVALLVKNLPANAGDIRDVGLIPGLGISPREGNGNSFQYSCLENPMARGVWWAIVHRVTKSWTQLKWLNTHTHTHTHTQNTWWPIIHSVWIYCVGGNSG